MSRASTFRADTLPLPDRRPLALRIHPGAERALRSGHPWLFGESVTGMSREGNPGDIAVVFDRKDRFLAAGLYDPFGPIRVRLLVHRTPETIGGELFRSRLGAALRDREPLTDSATDGVRLVHGEADRLPGLVVDRYGTALVVKLYSAAWIPWLPDLLEGMRELADPERIALLLARNVAATPGSPPELRGGAVLVGDPEGFHEGLSFLESGFRFEAHPFAGHKTGFYLDQRENRRRLEGAARGARVLNAFSYTGGFSLYAARGGAKEVVSLDQAAPALAQAVRHFELNLGEPGVRESRHRTLQGDAFEVMERLGASAERFDVVVVDPPSFAKERSQARTALAQYARLARLALRLLPPGGLLVQASCSSRIPADDFYAVVHRAARESGRPLREEARTGHPPDHPVRFAEGAYLKALWARPE